MAHQYNENIPPLGVPGGRNANTPHGLAAATRRIVVEQATVRAINPEAGAPAWFAPAMAAVLGPAMAAVLGPILHAVQGQFGAMQLQMEAMQANTQLQFGAMQAQLEAMQANTQLQFGAMQAQLEAMQANTQLGAMQANIQLQLGAMQTNAVIRHRNNRYLPDLQALVKEAPLLAGQEPGPNLGALGAVPPAGMFPASVNEIEGLIDDQVTAIATWYGIAGTMIPPEGDAGIVARRSALKAWVGV